MAAQQQLDKNGILDQLKKEGVTDLNSLAEFIVKNSYQDGDSNKPITNGVIIYTHGFVKS